MPENMNLKAPRYALLDELRGAAIILMVVYHAFYSLGYVFGSETGRALLAGMGPAQPFVAGTFIVLCGVCSRLSRSNLKRGLKLAGAAALVTLATLAMTLFGVQEVILFGVLHFLACAVLLFALLQKLPVVIPPWAQTVVFLALFIAWRFVPLPQTDLFPLYVLGFPSPAFSSADYFPVFPWLFLFLAGTALGIYAGQGRLPAGFVQSRVPALAWLGRHSLLIYLLHQPVLAGVFSLLRLVFPL